MASEKDRLELFQTASNIVEELRPVVDGSVRIGSPVLEAYPTVWQLTLPIEAETRNGINLPELFRTLYPPTSIAGVPKRAALRWIERLEGTPRGLYTGVIGIIDSRKAQFSVAIRTAVVDNPNSRLIFGTGSGVTLHSDAKREYQEAILKAAILLPPTQDAPGTF
ncbi:chorismate binding enzyme [Brockia lithotrophica]|uniref:Chorismate binding enzyme n=1 Tax=Brockia lithotrophica TaxID=933949 RepID=A0A660L5B2_9BACL|nr:chorismate binding enzyme [Brockia lithotrophica]